jgi:hypothetical protein
MPFVTKTTAQIRDELLRDIKNQLQLTDDKLGEDSDWFVRASSVAVLPRGFTSIRAGLFVRFSRIPLMLSISTFTREPEGLPRNPLTALLVLLPLPDSPTRQQQQG